jgi:hypothetical protein
MPSSPITVNLRSCKTSQSKILRARLRLFINSVPLKVFRVGRGRGLLSGDIRLFLFNKLFSLHFSYFFEEILYLFMLRFIVILLKLLSFMLMDKLR